MRIAHLLNPVRVPETSDLFVAQTITFASMQEAKSWAHLSGITVDLLSAQFPEDRDFVPDGFFKTPDLSRSLRDIEGFTDERKLPFLRDLLDRLYEASENADVLVYTNVDIGLVPHFYLSIARLLEDGYDAFTINRREVSASYATPEALPLICAEVGTPHSGYDCFVFRRSLHSRLRIPDVVTGAAVNDFALLYNLHLYAERFERFLDLHLTFHIGCDGAWKKGKRSVWRKKKSLVEPITRYNIESVDRQIVTDLPKLTAEKPDAPRWYLQNQSFLKWKELPAIYRLSRWQRFRRWFNYVSGESRIKAGRFKSKLLQK